jgi:hypothetical protein
MADDCCRLVGNFDICIPGCIISINSNCSTEVSIPCGEENPLEGATIQTVSISAYASDQIHIGCPGKAGVNIPWVRKYDCEADIVYFIWSGQGQSFLAGDVQNLATIKNSLGEKCNSISASSSSGPASIYMLMPQENGYGLTYKGDPIDFDTDETGTLIELCGDGIDGQFYLQSFNLDVQPGQLPVANYTMVRQYTD